MLEQRYDSGRTCLGTACVFNLGVDSLRLLLEYLSKYTDIKKLLENEQYRDQNCVYLACGGNLIPKSFRLLLEHLSKHADIKKVLEAKNNEGHTCLHQACDKKLSFDSLHLLLEYLSKWADIKTIVEARTNYGFTFLHNACYYSLPADSLRLIISFFPSKELFTHVVTAKNVTGRTSVEYADSRKYEIKKILQDPDCFEKCRLWLLRNHEDTFLYSLFPNSFDKTCQALKELTKTGLQHTREKSTIMLIALMSSSTRFREAVNKTDSSAPMARYFEVVKKGHKKSDYNQWRKNIHLFREFYGQWPPSERKTATTYEGEDSCCACALQ